MTDTKNSSAESQTAATFVSANDDTGAGGHGADEPNSGDRHDMDERVDKRMNKSNHDVARVNGRGAEVADGDPRDADPRGADLEDDLNADADSQDAEDEDEGADSEGADSEDADVDGIDAEGADGVVEPTQSDLFRQSEIAADYIEGLLDILDFDGDIDELVHNGRPVVEVVGGRLNNLIGVRGATLEALQELSRLAVYRQTGQPSRLLLDVGGFRAARRKELVAIAKNAAEKVKQHGEIVRLEPMSAFERKCVHDVINAMSGVESESEGVEPSRRIVIRPVDD